ncbi:MAG: flagellar hook-basal body complex protein FliE [Arsenophonus endosymbiont of Dermacentor nuttalli]
MWSICKRPVYRYSLHIQVRNKLVGAYQEIMNMPV